MIGAAAPSMDGDGELDFLGLLLMLWAHKWIILLVTGLSAGAAVAYAMLATPIYRAEVVITDVRESSSGGLASQLGSLTSLAGVTLGANNSEGQEARAVLQSRHLIEEFLSRNDLMAQILPETTQPRVMWSAVKRFQKAVLSIHDDTRKGTVTVSIEWPDPDVAARWANGVVALANDLLRTRALEESKRNLGYLNDQISHTDSVEIRAVLYDLVKSETKTLMLANGRVDYAFRVVDPAVPPAQRTSPQRTAIVVSCALLALICSSAGVLFHARVRRRRDGVRSSARAFA